MQYDLKKELTDKSKFNLQWHGEDTKVLIYGDAEKTEVKKGDVISVSLKQAHELLSYSYLWTLEGDQPVKHQYNDMLVRMAAKAAKKAKTDETEEGGEEDEEEEIDTEKIDSMKKAELVSALKKQGVSFNDQATKAELAGLLKEVLAEKAQTETETEVTDETEEEVTDETEEGGEK